LKELSNRALVGGLALMLLMTSACLVGDSGNGTLVPPTTVGTSTSEETNVPTWTSLPATTTVTEGASHSLGGKATETPTRAVNILQSGSKTAQPDSGTRTLTSAPVLRGMSRIKPMARGALIQAPNWDVQVLDYVRGKKAEEQIVANPLNEPPPPGQEYILVKLRARCTYADEEKHWITAYDFKVTGDRLREYEAILVNAPPNPELYGELAAGEQTEGWAVFLVPDKEKNLILVLDEMANLDDGRWRYVGLDDNAAVGIPAGLDTIQTTDTGSDATQPAGFEDRLVSGNWEVSLLEMRRGAAAWDLISHATADNPAPEDGMEYIILRVKASFLGQEDRSERIDNFYFYIQTADGDLMDFPQVIPPEPALDVSLYPGGEAEGWIALQAPTAAINLLLVFEPRLDPDGQNRRYVVLGQ
jgi:hypothetical protein